MYVVNILNQFDMTINYFPACSRAVSPFKPYLILLDARAPHPTTGRTGSEQLWRVKNAASRING